MPNTTGVGMVARHRLRSRWPSDLAVTLLVGVVGGLVLGTVAGARRTGSALSRFEETTRSDGAVLTGEGNDPFFDLNNYYRYFVARYAPDADRDAVDQAIEDNPALLRRPAGTIPADIDHLRQVDWVPVALAALLAVLSLLAVGHALVSSVRRLRSPTWPPRAPLRCAGARL